ncbi:MAG TPA: nitroreductase family protein [bacterium]|nr:nitroreductase family protein [bacterium]
MKNSVKYFIFFAVLFFCLADGFCQENKNNQLPEPQISGGKPLMDALSQRKSLRSFSQKEISRQVLSNLLWAAFGVNRPESGRRTAPSASNAQEIDIYVATAQGVFVYDAKANQLKPVIQEDIRGISGRQAFIKDASLVLIYVADYRRMRGQDAQKDFYSATDTGFISQNVYLFCASEGLSTVVVGITDRKVLGEKLGLAAEQKVILVQPVGYPK